MDDYRALIVVGLLFVVIGLVVWDDTIPRILSIVAGALFVLEGARRGGKSR